MKKSLRALAVVAAPVPIIASIALAAPANAASAAPLVAVPQNVSPAVAHSNRVADVTPDQRMSVSIGLKLHDQAALDRFLAEVADPHSARYHHYLTPQQFAADYGPSTQDVVKVTDFLRAKGLRVTGVSGNRQVVDASGTASQVETAFGTRLGVYTDRSAKHRRYYANDSAPTLPADVASVVQGVSGLDDYAMNRSDAVSHKSNPHTPSGFTPSRLRTAYDTGSLGDASGQTVALWEFDGYQAANISAYDKQFGLSSSAPTTVSVDGANYDSKPGQGQGEVELDIEIVQAMASAASTLVYEAPNSDQGQIDMAAKIVSDKKASVVSISWGQCEKDSASATITSTDNNLKQGAAEGISFYAASGDSGSADCQDGSTSVDYPASDPYVTGVGGTTLTAGSDGGYQSETAWNGSGGGVSTVFGNPSWQPGSNGKRTVPDVSSDADPNSGYAIYSAGSWQVYGGTSCAAPMWAGFTALFDAKNGSALGSGNTAIYQANGSGFHDITSGGNGGFSAGQGYDQVTGWGSYDGAKLYSALGGK